MYWVHLFEHKTIWMGCNLCESNGSSRQYKDKCTLLVRVLGDILDLWNEFLLSIFHGICRVLWSLSSYIDWILNMSKNLTHTHTQRSNIREETAECETSQYRYQTTYTHARDNRHNKNTVYHYKQYNAIRRHKRTSTLRKLATVNLQAPRFLYIGQAFRYSPENAFYIFNQQIYFIIWYLLDRASLI